MHDTCGVVENVEDARRASDYRHAQQRVYPGPGRGYDVAKHFSRVIADRHRLRKSSLEQSFRQEVTAWKKDTAHLSSIAASISHPSYLRIIGLARYSRGDEIERLLLKELETDPDFWFDALAAISGEDPVSSEHDFDEAVEAWISWGKRKGII